MIIARLEELGISASGDILAAALRELDDKILEHGNFPFEKMQLREITRDGVPWYEWSLETRIEVIDSINNRIGYAMAEISYYNNPEDEPYHIHEVCVWQGCDWRWTDNHYIDPGLE